MKPLDPRAHFELPKPKTQREELLSLLSDAASGWYQTSNPEYVKDYHDLYHELRTLGWNGSIDVDSKLPVALMPHDYLKEVADAEAAYHERTGPSTSTEAPILRESAGRILVVLNDFHVRTHLGILLGLLGYTVSPARDVRQALETLSEQRPSLIILDLTMPNMGAADILTAIRQAVSDVPILALREKSNRGQLAALKAAGIDSSMIKSGATRKLLLDIGNRVLRLLPERAELR